jgi:hypothetical protein
MRRLSLLILLLYAGTSVWAQQSDYPQRIDQRTVMSNEQVLGTDDLLLGDISALTDAQIDSIDLNKKLHINDYVLFGVQYGAGLSQVMWNPTQKQEMVFTPLNFGVTITKYQKMFGYMPYFGFQAGVFYAQEGYQFKYNENTDYIYKVEGAEKALINVVEVPVLFQFHLDMWNFKLMANLGCYGGYRLSIERFPGESGYVSEELAHSFKDTDRRVDYGLKGGVGFGLVFDPIEIHFQAAYKHSLSSLYTPDHYSKYYYRFAYPSNIVISVGLHYQLTKRTGRTRSELKAIARDMVYNPEKYSNENTENQSRKGNNRR